MKRANYKSAVVAAAALSVMGLANSANATIIANDPMNYGPSNGQSLASATDNGGDTNFTGGWHVVVGGAPDATVASPVSMVNAATGVTYTAAADFNGTGGSNIIDYRVIATADQPSTASGTSVFVSVLINNLNPTAPRAFLLSLYSADSTFTDLGGPSAKDVLDIGNEAAGFWGFNPAQTGGLNTTFSSNTSSTTLLVAELDYNGGGGKDTEELFVNPNSSTLQSDWTLQKTGLSLQNIVANGAGAQIGDVRLFAGNGTSPAEANVDFADIVIGTQFSDVVGAPEPATLGLLLPAALLAGSRRFGRRRAEKE